MSANFNNPNPSLILNNYSTEFTSLGLGSLHYVFKPFSHEKVLVNWVTKNPSPSKVPYRQKIQEIFMTSSINPKFYDRFFFDVRVLNKMRT